MTIELKDGDEILIVTTEPTVWDPLGKYKISRLFKVISVKGPSPSIELMPQGETKIEVC